MPRPTVGIIKNFKPEVEATDTTKCFLCRRNYTLREYLQPDNSIGVHRCMLTKITVVPSSVSSFSTRVRFTPVLTTDEYVARPEDASAVYDEFRNISYPDPFQAEGYLTRWQLEAGDDVRSYTRFIYEPDELIMLLCSRCYRFLREWLNRLEEPGILSAREYAKRAAENRRLIELGAIPPDDRRSYIERRNSNKTDRRVINVFKIRFPHEVDSLQE